jgi:hypothetical protein
VPRCRGAGDRRGRLGSLAMTKKMVHEDRERGGHCPLSSLRGGRRADEADSEDFDPIAGTRAEGKG